MLPEPRPGEPWTRLEIEALVSAYFGMLEAELAGVRPVKADVNRHLQAVLPARSRGSIEYKLQNVSAVLEAEGVPFIDGYKPARNFQRELATVVLSWLGREHRVVEELAEYGSNVPLAMPPVPRLSDVLVPLPASAARGDHSLLTRGPEGAIDDARNKALGLAGEEWVIGVERAELRALGRGDLADRIEWVAKTRGDGLGYDVASYQATGEPIQIEVKTTNMGPRAPFYLTRRELAASEELSRSYRLYRVFEFARRPRIFVLPGALHDKVSLEPLTYSAHLL